MIVGVFSGVSQAFVSVVQPFLRDVADGGDFDVGSAEKSGDVIIGTKVADANDADSDFIHRGSFYRVLMK